MDAGTALRLVSSEISDLLSGALPALSEAWWETYVLQQLSHNQRERIRGKEGQIRSLDLASLLTVFTKNFFELKSARHLAPEAKSYAYQMRDIRNRYAHASVESLEIEDLHRDLDTIERFLKSITASEEAVTWVSREKKKALKEMSKGLSGGGNQAGQEISDSAKPMPTGEGSASEGRNFSRASVADKLKKADALRIVLEKTGLRIQSSKSTFANIGTSNETWWLEPQASRFVEKLFLILNDQRSRGLYVFEIPANTYAPAERYFYIRPDNGRVSIVIDSNDTSRFTDIRSTDSRVEFKRHLVASIRY